MQRDYEQLYINGPVSLGLSMALLQGTTRSIQNSVSEQMCVLLERKQILGFLNQEKHPF